MLTAFNFYFCIKVRRKLFNKKKSIQILLCLHRCFIEIHKNDQFKCKKIMQKVIPLHFKEKLEERKDRSICTDRS